MNKPIEEMAIEFAKINCNEKGCGCCDLIDEYGSLELSCEDYLKYKEMAQTFYNAGYRKASDVAREIFAEIEHSFMYRNADIYSGDIFIDKVDFAEFKKKYGVTEE
jgi:hypothetical protein